MPGFTEGLLWQQRRLYRHRLTDENSVGSIPGGGCVTQGLCSSNIYIFHEIIKVELVLSERKGVKQTR